MKYHFKIHKENNVYWAQGVELQTCFTQADSLEELKENLKDALNHMIEEPADSNDLAPLPDESIKLSKDMVEVELDPNIAFAFLMRYLRIKRGLTQQQAAERMGFESLFSYQRLEMAGCNPTLKILYKIKKLFPEFSLDYVLGIEY